MGKGRKRPQKKGTEGHRPKLPAPAPSSRGTTKGASKVTAEGRLAVTEAPVDRQDETSRARAALTTAGEEPGAGVSRGQGFQQQGRSWTAINREKLAHTIVKVYAIRAKEMNMSQGMEEKQDKTPGESLGISPT